MSSQRAIERLIHSRQALRPPGLRGEDREQAAEGGCGVIGIACNEQIAGRHLLQALDQMRNRGNGKGGGIAAVGLAPEAFGVPAEVLQNDYLLAVAYLDPSCRAAVERQHVAPVFEVDHVREAPHLEDYRQLKRLEVRPPEVVQYFVRVRQDAYDAFRRKNELDLPQRRIEDEIVYQNSYRLNSHFYASTGETRAFVLSHGKNLLVMKMVGYGDDVIRYYQLQDLQAHVWIGHHRYPTKGRVWHPGGAHPFVGLNEALVHNGDFANYASIVEYLAQRNIHPLFLTDTEVSALVFDLLHRTYNYPLEYVIEALAPTTERDYALLPPDKQHLYGLLQVTHMHCSPDGPWFFLIAQSEEESGRPVHRLTGITDTSMLRPQVFAWQAAGEEGPAVGFAASEKQAIDAALASLASEDDRFWPRPDRTWNARGGSHTDGGAFIFSAYPNGDGSARLVCTDKFGRPVESDISRSAYRPNDGAPPAMVLPAEPAPQLFRWTVQQMPGWGYEGVCAFLKELEEMAGDDEGRQRAFKVLTLLIDRRYPTGELRRSSLLALYDDCLARLVASVKAAPSRGYAYLAAGQPAPERGGSDQKVVVDARGFEPEGPASLALALVRLHERGFARFMVVHAAGHRFIGNGFGAGSQGIHIDVYGSSGDYLGSGIDGMEVVVHDSGQDQLAQIMKSGKLVVHGDVGQTFGYAAKGGEAYILGSAAGRPLINAVGRPRVVINGTCLDYLAESFMAGNPYQGGGFVIVNGIRVTDYGEVEELDTPYPGGNLFSLASGGAIFMRDPYRQLADDQLNGGEFQPFEERDWALIHPYLEENSRLFGISIDRLLESEGRRLAPAQVYRKIVPARVRALQAEEAWVRKT